MEELAWLAKHRLLSVERQTYRWVFLFDKTAKLVLNGFWRHIAEGRIWCTSEDDGQQFGLPAPVDAVSELNQFFSGVDVQSVTGLTHLRGLI